MLRDLQGKEVTIVRAIDQTAYIGEIDTVQSPVLHITFHTDTDLKPGQPVCARLSDGSDSLRLEATVVAKDHKSASLWVTVHSMVPEIHREPRAQVSPISVILMGEDQSFQAYLVDVSLSGIRVTSANMTNSGSDFKASIGIGMTPIELDCEVVRFSQPVGSSAVEAGLRITSCSRLMAARWKHFVDAALAGAPPNSRRMAS